MAAGFWWWSAAFLETRLVGLVAALVWAFCYRKDFMALSSLSVNPSDLFGVLYWGGMGWEEREMIGVGAGPIGMARL